jgi:EmrB/QacA subfamily drug resistance transporter
MAAFVEQPPEHRPMTQLVSTTRPPGIPTAPQTRTEPLPRLPWRTFSVTALGAFMASLDLSIVNVAFPALRASFPGTSSAGLAWVITAYTIVFAALLVTAGRIADRFGRRRTFFAGVAVFAVGSAIGGAAPSVDLLIASRTVQAVGAALLVPSSVGLLLAACPEEKRPQTIALWGGVGALAVAIGPSLGAALVSAAGWRSAFYLNVPVALLSWLAGRQILPSDRLPPRLEASDYIGVVLLSLSLACLVLAISESSEWGWSDPRIIAACASSVTAGMAFIRRCLRHPHPVLDLALFRARTFTVANAATVTYAMGFFAMLLGSVLFLTGVWHYSVLKAGLALTPAPLVVMLISGPAGQMAARVGFRPPVVAGSATLAAGLFWYATALGSQPDYISAWLPGYLMVGVGVGLTLPVLSGAAVSGLPPAHFAVGSAVNQTCRQVGGAVGIAILVALLGKGTAGQATLSTFRHLWIYSAMMAMSTGVISSLLPSTRRSAPALARLR